MSTIELREKLRVMPRAERQEMLTILQDLEAAEQAASPAVSGTRSFEEAMEYTFGNFDTALRKLAQ